ncbi:MAG: hypothetical protein R3B95_11650 [Nitrospirales bacterium]|nr:hypothetical protein [Nitrospirales bacterium]
MMMQCSACGKFFPHGKKQRPSAMQNHIAMKHKGNAEMMKPPKPDDVEIDDESFASRAIQAELDEAMGIENFDREWLI